MIILFHKYKKALCKNLIKTDGVQSQQLVLYYNIYITMTTNKEDIDEVVQLKQ